MITESSLSEGRATLPTMNNGCISIMAKGVRQPDEETWERQRSLLERSGATYCGETRAWWLDVDPADGQRAAASLAHLFDAARKYGATVRVLDPITEMPAAAPDPSPTNRS